jgi:hypothetical protein
LLTWLLKQLFIVSELIGWGANLTDASWVAGYVFFIIALSRMVVSELD